MLQVLTDLHVLFIDGQAQIYTKGFQSISVKIRVMTLTLVMQVWQ